MTPMSTDTKPPMRSTRQRAAVAAVLDDVEEFRPYLRRAALRD